MPRKIVRASEYWNEEAPRPTRVSGRDWQDLVRGPSIQPGLLHFAASDEAQTPEEHFRLRPQDNGGDYDAWKSHQEDLADETLADYLHGRMAAVNAPDPSMPGEDEPEEQQRKMMQELHKLPSLREISQATTSGGARGDGTPENWPGQLPGDQLMGDIDQATGGIINRLPKLLGKGE